MSVDIGSNYVLARATEEMAGAIAQEVNQAYGNQFNQYLLDTPEHPIARTTEEKIRALVADPSYRLYVLINKANRAVAGTICYVPSIKPQKPALGYFGLFSLAPEAHGRDIGTQMIAQIENIARSEGKTRMKIDVSGFASRLHAYYQRNGYSLTGKTIPFADNIHWQLKPEYEGDSRSSFLIFKKQLA